MTFVDPLPGVLVAALNRVMTLDESAQNALARQNGYEMRVFGRAFDLGAAFEELEHLLDLLGRTKSFQEISLLIKVYFIGWVALSDMLANLINEIFDLGYAEQDVQFGVIMRNRHLRTTGVQQVIRRHTKAIQYDDYVKRRNDIVHRGKLDDPEFMDVRGAVMSAVVLRRLRVDRSDAAAVEAANREALSESRADELVREFLAARRLQYSDHLAATRSMLNELSRELIARIQAQPRVTSA